MSELLRANPGLLVWVVLFAITALVLCAVGRLMKPAGVSLRCLYWFAGFILLIGLPQFVFHFYSAVAARREAAPRRAALREMAVSADPERRRQAVRLLFGTDADPDLVLDPGRMFAEVVGKAIAARFASLPNGETVLLAQFTGFGEAEKAWVAYLRQTGLSNAQGEGDSHRGYAVTRPTGDRAYALPTANLLGVWTGPDDSAIRRRMAAGGFKIPRRTPLAGQPAPDVASPGTQGGGGVQWAAGGGALAVYLFLTVLYFFKGAAWAGSLPPAEGATPVTAGELTARLTSLNALDVPMRVERGGREGELNATWRYADAKWIDIARAHGLERVHRIKLDLDQAAHVVRVTDYAGGYDWSVGRHGAGIQWKSSFGITFFQVEHERVFGLQLPANGKGQLQPDLSYHYKFSLQELKAPLARTVTEAGWKWRPVVWAGPKWLRWLTE